MNVPSTDTPPFQLDLTKSVTRWDKRTLVRRILWATFVKPIFQRLLPKGDQRRYTAETVRRHNWATLPSGTLH